MTPNVLHIVGLLKSNPTLILHQFYVTSHVVRTGRITMRVCVCVHSSVHVLEFSHVENHPNCHYISWSTSTWMSNVGLKFTCHPYTPPWLSN
jgi:hypothetical protein